MINFPMPCVERRDGIDDDDDGKWDTAALDCYFYLESAANKRFFILYILQTIDETKTICNKTIPILRHDECITK